MLTIRHHRHGDPADVLEVTEVAEVGAPGFGQLRVRAEFACIHPGDLQSVEGAPNFGSPAPIGSAGRTPGFEGVGIVEAIGDGVDPAQGIAIGQRVAYFPVANGWSERILVPASSAIAVPDGAAPEAAAQALINTVTAETIIRAGHNAWPDDKRQNVTVIQTGAASAVARIVTALLVERGVSVIRLVRSKSSVRELELDGYGGPIICTGDADWTEQLRGAIAGRNIYVALDGVGGPVLSALTQAVAAGGTIISYGALDGQSTDVRWVVPRRLSIKGVNVGEWTTESQATKRADIQTAMRLALTKPELFPVAAVYPPNQIHQAAAHVLKPGRLGAVLLAFSGQNA